MTYLNCKKVITNKIKTLNEEQFAKFAIEMKDKLDVFLLNERLTNIEYNELINMINNKEIYS